MRRKLTKLRNNLLGKEQEETERRLATLMRDSNDAITVQDFSGNILVWNRGAQQMYGYTQAEALKMNMRNIIPQAKREETTTLKKRLRAGKIIGSLETQRSTKDGRTLDVWLTVTNLVDDSGKPLGFCTTERDISERKRVEDKLRKAHEELKCASNELHESQARLIQTEKMSAVGTVVAGIAHEMNDPMMGMLNFAQYCQKHTAKDEPIYTVLQDIERETKRCVDIVQNLLSFSHFGETREAYQKESCTVILDRVLKLLSYRIEKLGVSVTRHTADGTPEIWMKPNSIQQVFFNLVINALDALEESEKKEIRIDVRRDGEFAQATVADTGGGIAPGNLQKVFDPFFTTKSAEWGIGLGLSVCRDIVGAHRGKITCESEPGAGTKFKVLLPIERREKNG